jgi:hypothetical protein
MTQRLISPATRTVARTLAAILVCGCLLASRLEAAGGAPEVPTTPMPDFKGCSSSQIAFLEDAWRLAHVYTWRSARLLDFIKSRPAAERADLWRTDHVAGSTTAPSPRTWFGAYESDRADKVRSALEKALARFEARGDVVKRIGTIRCGRPIAPAADVNVDKCPSSNPGGNGAPSAYHFPIGTVVTCEEFWDNVGGNREAALSVSAKILVHEMFHWLSVDGKYVTDYHGDGVKGMPDQKYYGDANALMLAEQKPAWAIYNNDNYARFARRVGASWDTLVARWKPLGGTE